MVGIESFRAYQQDDHHKSGGGLESLPQPNAGLMRQERIAIGARSVIAGSLRAARMTSHWFHFDPKIIPAIGMPVIIFLLPHGFRSLVYCAHVCGTICPLGKWM